MSFLTRIFNAFRRPARYVGRDLEGNRFYEYPSTSDDPRRTKRVVKYADPDHMTSYIGGNKRLPIQWSSWLTHTRPQAPTLEELHADLSRQQRVLMNAAMIEARDREEQEQMARIRAEVQREALAPPSEPPGAEETQEQAKARSRSEVPPPRVENDKKVESQQQESEPPDSPWKTDVNPQPVAWAPRAIRRG